MLLEHYKIDVSEGIDVKKTTGSCELIICHYWYFPQIKFRFQPKVGDDCHDLMQKAISFHDVAIYEF